MPTFAHTRRDINFILTVKRLETSRVWPSL